MMSEMLAVIGGSGLSQLSNLDVSHREVVRTPYGEPSGAVTFGEICGRPIAFLARHGYGHTIPPHEVNYRANIWALCKRGAVGIISVASVGSIRADLKPGDLVIPHQIIDYTWGRKSSFHEGPECTLTHIDFTEPNAKRRNLAAEFGATVIDPTAVDPVEAVKVLTSGEKIQLLIESAGIGSLFKQMPGLIRKQATVVLYGHGHHGVDIGALNNVQFIEPTFISPVGASGGFDDDLRPGTYRKSLELLSSGQINVSRFITHRYRSLGDVPQAFAKDRFGSDYIKGVSVHGMAING